MSGSETRSGGETAVPAGLTSAAARDERRAAQQGSRHQQRPNHSDQESVSAGHRTDHIGELERALVALRGQSSRLTRWGTILATRLADGGRLLAAGNGGSAAEAQHLTAELVGRFDGERRPFSALALHADTSSLTAIGNDYGYHEVFARQVQAHARPRDVLVLLSTSGHSENLLWAARSGRDAGASVWAFTGALPNPLAELADEVLAVPGPTATVQEAQLVAVHLLCEAFESALSIVDSPRVRRAS